MKSPWYPRLRVGEISGRLRVEISATCSCFWPHLEKVRASLSEKQAVAPVDSRGYHRVMNYQIYTYNFPRHVRYFRKVTHPQT
jgi:hypothetical protein